MIKAALTTIAIGAMMATGPTSCSDKKGLEIQNQNVQDVSTFTPCDDDQGHSSVHPCVTRNSTDTKWIVWLEGVDQADCPVYTVQPKDEVLCLNATKE